MGHIAFRRDVTCVCACVTFVTRFKFTCKFRCKFTSAFLLQLITFIPSGLQSWNFVWHLPTSRPFNVWYRCPRVMPLGGARVWGAFVYCGHISSFTENFTQHVKHKYSEIWRNSSNYIYSRLSLSRIPKDSLKYFEISEISIPRQIRVERVRKTINWTTTFKKWICNLTPEVKKYK